MGNICIFVAEEETKEELNLGRREIHMGRDRDNDGEKNSQEVSTT